MEKFQEWRSEQAQKKGLDYPGGRPKLVRSVLVPREGQFRDAQTNTETSGSSSSSSGLKEALREEQIARLDRRRWDEEDARECRKMAVEGEPTEEPKEGWGM